MKIKVNGMHCKSCETILTEDLSAINGVAGVKADAAKGEVVLDADPSLLAAVKKAVKAAGYEVTG